MNNISIRLVDNLFIDEHGIYALSKQKVRSNVFLRQGNIDCSCMVYSFLMMLILKGKITRDDLEHRYKQNGDELVEKIRKKLIYNLNGPAKGGMTFYALAQKVNNWNLGVQIETITLARNHSNRAISRKQLIDYIEQNLKRGNPVQVGYCIPYDNCGHAVLAVGYSKGYEAITIYCIDPSSTLKYGCLWNEIIEMHPNENRDRHITRSLQIIVYSAATILSEQTYFDIPDDNTDTPF